MKKDEFAEGLRNRIKSLRDYLNAGLKEHGRTSVRLLFDKQFGVESKEFNALLDILDQFHLESIPYEYLLPEKYTKSMHGKLRSGLDVSNFAEQIKAEKAEIVGIIKRIRKLSDNKIDEVSKAWPENYRIYLKAGSVEKEKNRIYETSSEDDIQKADKMIEDSLKKLPTDSTPGRIADHILAKRWGEGGKDNIKKVTSPKYHGKGKSKNPSQKLKRKR